MECHKICEKLLIMKKTVIILICALFVSLNNFSQNAEFPKEKQEALKEVFKKYLDMGIPSLGISVYTPDTGMWSYADGYANLENKIPLTLNHKFYLQSISKTYMAVVILKLYEEGKISLDDPILNYLNYPWLKSIEGVEKITVKMLLNHTSGLPEYSTNPLLVSRIIQDPLIIISVPDMLSYIQNSSLSFEPGTKYLYRNTNYELLSLIADKVTGDHSAYMKKVIFDKLNLASTFYLTKENHKSNLNLVDAYWDVLQEGLPVNISKLQRANVASMRGDDGLISTTQDAVRFLRGLVEGELLKPETFVLMQDWVKDEKGSKRYGLGLEYYNLDVTYGIGHSGGGIGAGCVLMFLPELNSIVFLATNFNTFMDSPILKKAENLQTEILLTLFTE